MFVLLFGLYRKAELLHINTKFAKWFGAVRVNVTKR